MCNHSLIAYRVCAVYFMLFIHRLHQGTDCSPRGHNKSSFDTLLIHGLCFIPVFLLSIKLHEELNAWWIGYLVLWDLAFSRCQSMENYFLCVLACLNSELLRKVDCEEYTELWKAGLIWLMSHRVDFGLMLRRIQLCQIDDV